MNMRRRSRLPHPTVDLRIVYRKRDKRTEEQRLRDMRLHAGPERDPRWTWGALFAAWTLFVAAMAMAMGLVVSGGTDRGSVYTGRTAAVGGTVANLYVTGGTAGVTCTNTPTRQTTQVAYASAPLSAKACTMDQAYDASNCSDLVYARSGAYNGTFSGSKSCSGWTVSGTYGVTCTGCVGIEEYPGDTVTFSSTIVTTVTWLRLKDFSSTSGWDCGDAGVTTTTNHILMENLSLSSPNGKWQRFSVVGGAATDIAWVGGEMNGAESNGGEPIYLVNMTGVTLDGVFVHNSVENPIGDHVEPLRIDGGVSDMRVRYNRFENNDENTSTFFWTNAQVPSGMTNPHDLSFVGNVINVSGGAPFGIKPQDPVITVCLNISIIENTVIGATALNTTTCSHTNVLVRGNAGAKSFSDCGSATWDRNVWQHTVNTACGTDTWVSGTAFSTSALGLGGTLGYTPQSGSALKGAGPLVANCTARDYFGTTRPQPGGATNCDAGAVEVT